MICKKLSQYLSLDVFIVMQKYDDIITWNNNNDDKKQSGYKNSDL